MHVILSQTQLQQGLEKGQRRLRALILVLAVGMQAVSTTARRWVVDEQVQVVAPKEPLKGASGFLVPKLVPGHRRADKSHWSRWGRNAPRQRAANSPAN